MKASQDLFRSITALVEKGLSPSRAAKAVCLSPDTVSRWRREFPEFGEMIAQAESKFIATMTACVADAAPKDWRAAIELLARRFPLEFSRDAAAANREPERPFVSREEQLIGMARTPSGREMLLNMGVISQEWLQKHKLELEAPAPVYLRNGEE